MLRLQQRFLLFLELHPWRRFHNIHMQLPVRLNICCDCYSLQMHQEQSNSTEPEKNIEPTQHNSHPIYNYNMSSPLGKAPSTSSGYESGAVKIFMQGERDNSICVGC